MARAGAVPQTFYVQTAVYDTGAQGVHTWQCLNDTAPLSFSMSCGGTPANERNASNTFPVNQVILDPTSEVTLNLSSVIPESMPKLSDMGTLTLTLVINDHDSTTNIVLYRFVYAGMSAEQPRAGAGGIQLTFVGESTCNREDCMTDTI